MKATCAIATDKSDARLAAEYRRKGAAARTAGKPRTDAPGGMIGRWWLEGYDVPDSAGGPARPL